MSEVNFQIKHSVFGSDKNICCLNKIMYCFTLKYIYGTMMLSSSDNYLSKFSKYNKKYLLKENHVANRTLFGRKVHFLFSFIKQCILFTQKKMATLPAIPHFIDIYVYIKLLLNAL